MLVLEVRFQHEPNEVKCTDFTNANVKHYLNQLIEFGKKYIF